MCCSVFAMSQANLIIQTWIHYANLYKTFLKGSQITSASYFAISFSVWKEFKGKSHWILLKVQYSFGLEGVERTWIDVKLVIWTLELIENLNGSLDKFEV